MAEDSLKVLTPWELERMILEVFGAALFERGDEADTAAGARAAAAQEAALTRVAGAAAAGEGEAPPGEPEACLRSERDDAERRGARCTKSARVTEGGRGDSCPAVCVRPVLVAFTGPAFKFSLRLVAMHAQPMG